MRQNSNGTETKITKSLMNCSNTCGPISEESVESRLVTLKAIQKRLDRKPRLRRIRESLAWWWYRLVNRIPYSLGLLLWLKLRTLPKLMKLEILNVMKDENRTEEMNEAGTSSVGGNEDLEAAERLASEWQRKTAESQGTVYDKNESEPRAGADVSKLVTPRDCGAIGAAVFGLIPSVALKSDTLLWSSDESEQWGTAAHPIVADWLKRIGNENAQLGVLVAVTALIESRKIAAFKNEQRARVGMSIDAET